jgi:enoyl-CoA hydratase/carnithine racemase
MLIVTQVNEEILIKAVSDGVLRLTLNDSQRRNALSVDMLSQLMDAFASAADDASIRVIVIAAIGPAFCSGHDLKEMTESRNDDDGGEAFFEQLFETCASLMQSIVRHPKPVIAEVRGVATAAGCQLVASCDLALAAETAQFATPGVNIGLFCSTPMVALSRNVSLKHSMEMLLLGEMLHAEMAERIGLINRVVPQSDLSDATSSLAQMIAAKSPKTVAIGKRAFYEQAEMSLSDAYVHTAKVMARNMLNDDAIEGIEAFLQKRSPSWQNNQS